MNRTLAQRLLALAALAVAGAAPARAADGRWTLFGPPVGTFVRLTPDPFDPQTLFALTEGTQPSGRISRSRDGGRTWSLAADGLAGDPYVNGLAFDPLHRGTLYTASLTAVYRSTDGGARWTKVSDAAWQPYAPGTAGQLQLAATASRQALTLFCGTVDKILRSGDGGRTWTTALTGITPNLLIADSTGGFYVAAIDGRVRRTLDGGGSWTDVWPPAGTPAGQGPDAFAVDPQRPSTLYAATRTALFASLDRGANWREITTLPPEDGVSLTAIAVDPVDPRTLYVAHDAGLHFAVWVSTNRGASWTDRPVALPERLVTLWVDRGSHGLDAASAETLVASADGGKSWDRRISLSLAFDFLEARLRFDPRRPKTLWLATEGRLFTSADTGASWRGVRVSVGDVDLLVEDLAISPNRSNLLFAGTQTGVLRSRDGGATWQRFDAAGGETPAVVAVTALTILAGGNGVLRTADGGLTWQTVLSSDTGVARTFRLARKFYPHPTRPATLFLLTDAYEITPRAPAYRYSELFRSEDGGATWTFLERADPVLAFDPAHPDSLLRLDGRGLFASSSLGDSWTRIGDLPGDTGGNAFALVVDPAASDHLFAVVDAKSVFRSTDGGASWKRASAGLQLVFFPESLWADPATPHLFYLGNLQALFTARLP